MKKIILIGFASALLLTSCSSDEADSLSNQNLQPNEPVAGQEYKLFVIGTNLEKSDFTYKTKTGNGQWVQHELQNWRFPVKYGDSVHVDSGTNSHPTNQTYIKLQVNNVVDWGDDRNYNYQFISTLSNQSLSRKFKIEFSQN